MSLIIKSLDLYDPVDNVESLTLKSLSFDNIIENVNPENLYKFEAIQYLDLTKCNIDVVITIVGFRIIRFFGNNIAETFFQWPNVRGIILKKRFWIKREKRQKIEEIIKIYETQQQFLKARLLEIEKKEEIRDPLDIDFIQRNQNKNYQ